MRAIKLWETIVKLTVSPTTGWQSYKVLYQLTIFRYLITWFAIVPFIALVIQRLPKEIKFSFFTAQVDYIINLALPFSWELLWVSSLLFVISFGLYMVLELPREYGR